jgi:hypothetical protein
MPTKRSRVKNERQYERLKKKGMSKSRAAKIGQCPQRVEAGWEEDRIWLSVAQHGVTGWNQPAEEAGRTQGRKGGRAQAVNGPWSRGRAVLPHIGCVARAGHCARSDGTMHNSLVGAV